MGFNPIGLKQLQKKYFKNAFWRQVDVDKGPDMGILRPHPARAFVRAFGTYTEGWPSG